MALDLTDVMAGIGSKLGSIVGLRVFDFPPLSAQAPFAFVDFPESIQFDASYGRGTDRMSLRVFLAVANQVDRTARAQLTRYAGNGPLSVKAAIEAENGPWQSVRVESVEFGNIELSSGTYMGAIFLVEVAA